MLRTSRPLIAGLTAFWLLTAVVSTLAFFGALRTGSVRMGDAAPASRIVALQMAPWLSLIAWTPLSVVLANRWRVGRPRGRLWRRAQRH